jgi:hypothetical protein
MRSLFVMRSAAFLSSAISFGVLSLITGVIHLSPSRKGSIRGSQRELDASQLSSIVPKEALEYNPNECLKDWVSLKGAMILAAVLNPNATPDFTLCPGQLFLLDTIEGEVLKPIDVQRSDSVFRCGADGKQENNCLIVGGYGHFKLVDRVKNAKFMGITFSDARLSSILAVGESSASAEFIDCAWVNHQGEAAILLYNDKDVPITSESKIVNLVEPREKSMSVSCTGCLFSKNNFINSTIVNLAGYISLTDSVFAENNVLGGVIMSKFTSTVSIEDSCFLSNKSILAGTVVVEEGSKVELNQNTFGDGNKIEFGYCEEVFYEKGDSCVGGKRPQCVGLCGYFTSSSGCSVDLGKIDALSELIEQM